MLDVRRVPQTLVFLTNHLTFGATTIAAIYKDRRQIENFFKAIKQNLRIKTFVGTSINALHVHLWTALIAILLLKILKLRSTFRWSMSNLVAMLRFNLFTYRDLWEWLNEPFQHPPQKMEDFQLSFFPSVLGQHTGGSSRSGDKTRPNEHQIKRFLDQSNLSWTTLTASICY